MLENKKERRLAFWELARGNFAQQFQSEFEQAQQIAMERNLPVKVTATILIAPPDPEDARFGRIGYKIKAAYPEIKSPIYTTELQNGSIMCDAPDVAALIQTNLFGDGTRLPFIPPAEQANGEIE